MDKLCLLHFSDCMNNRGTFQPFIDFPPFAKGKKGQILRYLHDPDKLVILADSLGTYLQMLMEDEYDFIAQGSIQEWNKQPGHQLPVYTASYVRTGIIIICKNIHCFLALCIENIFPNREYPHRIRGHTPLQGLKCRHLAVDKATRNEGYRSMPIDVNMASRQKAVPEACVPLSDEGKRNGGVLRIACGKITEDL
ncbi:MAG: SMI1/KNR4 family protein [Lachnospiraceae bacterium]|nr:SMI1/KNR4 family protein [Lachnospiraceae bacterium]